MNHNEDLDFKGQWNNMVFKYKCRKRLNGLL